MAKFKKCPNGHQYDTSIYGESCPFCSDTRIVSYATLDDLQFRCSNCGTEFFSSNLEDLCCPNCGQSKINCNVLSIGRGNNCDIIVNSVYVNALHANIRYVNREGGYFLYYDLSTNGTTIDGLRSQKGDVIKIPDNNCNHEILLAGRQDAILDWHSVIMAFCQCPEYKECHNPTCYYHRSAPSPAPSYQIIDDCETGLGLPPQRFSENKRTYTPLSNTSESPSFWSRLFCKKNKQHSAYSSVFAPAEIAPKQHLLVQVYLHLPEETEKVKALASEADKSAERRGYEPLEVPLKKGDNVDIELNVNGDSLLYNCRKSIVWQGSFVKRAFDFVVPSDINVSELSCSVNVFVNGAIAGELIFLTAIVDSPRQLNTNVYAKPTRKLFISYSHKDVHSAEKIAKIHEALGIDVFFDKHRLKAGYIYSEEISRFIQTADTFVLCWSENAANSDYVEKERHEALALAYPQRRPREQARLRIHPYNIEPHAVPPADMIEHYHFEEL